MNTDLKDRSVPEVLAGLKSQVEQLLVLLSQKERVVVEKRFSLGTDRRHTLEEIGQQFNVTRERVRQIEKNALQKLKRNAENFGVSAVNDRANEILSENGGIMREDIMISRLLSAESGPDFNSLQFILSLDKRFMRVPNTIKYYPHVRFSHLGDAMIESVCAAGMETLKKHGDVMDIGEIKDIAAKRFPGCADLNPSFFSSLFGVHKSFKVIKNQVGLMEWRHIHPRTLRDKIYFILRQKNEPMHFVDIGNLIQTSSFDRKRLNMQAVHNELIRHPDFVLIGRGIYALKEWGYEHGTVSDVIKDVLRGKDSMSEEEIIDEVLKRRQVKRITIILNLKNKPDFIRIGRRQYSLKKA